VISYLPAIGLKGGIKTAVIKDSRQQATSRGSVAVLLIHISLHCI